MQIMPVSPISSSQNPPQAQSGPRQNLNDLQSALSSGNLVEAQRAMTAFAQSLQDNQLPVNGVRAAASDNPESTLRSDREALQSALDAGDVTAAQRSLVRILQDTAQIASAQQAGDKPVSALPNPDCSDEQDDPAEGAREGSGNLIDVMA
jgi:hypothetical protein